MAEKRMFNKSIVLCDDFLDMPLSSRCLYFTLGMLADDDGFINNPKSIMRQCGSSIDDMKILLAKKYVLEFETGVIVIRHWRINNYLRSDRYKSTTCIEEKSRLYTEKNGAYTLERSEEKKKVKFINQFTKPTIEEIKTYIREKSLNVDSERFFNYYESNGWRVGRNSMKDWKASLRAWNRNNFNTRTSLVNQTGINEVTEEDLKEMNF